MRGSHLQSSCLFSPWVRRSWHVIPKRVYGDNQTCRAFADLLSFNLPTLSSDSLLHCRALLISGQVSRQFPLVDRRTAAIFLGQWPCQLPPGAAVEIAHFFDTIAESDPDFFDTSFCHDGGGDAQWHHVIADVNRCVQPLFSDSKSKGSKQKLTLECCTGMAVGRSISSSTLRPSWRRRIWLWACDRVSEETMESRRVWQLVSAEACPGDDSWWGLGVNWSSMGLDLKVMRLKDNISRWITKSEAVFSLLFGMVGWACTRHMFICN